MERENGHYWVKFDGHWTVAYWDGERCWKTIGYEDEFYDIELDEINPIQIQFKSTPSVEPVDYEAEAKRRFPIDESLKGDGKSIMYQAHVMTQEDRRRIWKEARQMSVPNNDQRELVNDLAEVKMTIQWMWDNLSTTVHPSDAFNRPANAISVIEKATELLSQQKEMDGKVAREGWISVNERKPTLKDADKNGFVLTWTEVNGALSRHIGSLGTFVTHWQPLPAPPIEKEGDDKADNQE